MGDSIVRRYDVDKGTLRSQMIIDGTRCVASDGKTLIAARNKVWDLEKGLRWSTKNAEKHLGHIFGFMPGGKTVVGLVRNRDGVYDGADSPVEWDLEADRPLRQLPQFHGGGGLQFAFTGDGKCCISAASTYALHRWDIATGKTLAPLDVPLDPARAFAFSRDRKHLATYVWAPWGDIVYVWECATGKRVCDARLRSGRDLALLSFTPDGKTLLCGGWTKIHSVDLATGKSTEHSLALERGASPRWAPAAGELSPDGTMVAVTDVNASSTGPVQLWDWKGNKQLGVLNGGDKDIVHRGLVAFSADGKRLACMVYPKVKPEVDNAPDGKMEKGGPDRIVNIKPPPPPRVQVWGLAEKKLLASWEVPPQFAKGFLTYGIPMPFQFRFIEDGEFLVGSWHNGVHVWNSASGKEKLHFEPPQKTKEQPKTLKIAPVTDGKLVAGIYQGEDFVRLWNLSTGKEVGQCHGHHGAVEALGFSSDGSLLATSGADTTVLLMDVRKLPGNR